MPAPPLLNPSLSIWNRKLFRALRLQLQTPTVEPSGPGTYEIGAPSSRSNGRTVPQAGRLWSFRLRMARRLSLHFSLTFDDVRGRDERGKMLSRRTSTVRDSKEEIRRFRI